MTQPAPGEIRAAHLAGANNTDPAPQACPGCGESGCLRETAGSGNRWQAAFLTCTACGWHSTQERAERGQGSVVLAGTDGTPDAVVDAEAYDCFLASQDRGTPGGGGGNARVKRQPKPGDRLRTRPDQEPPSGKDTGGPYCLACGLLHAQGQNSCTRCGGLLGKSKTSETVDTKTARVEFLLTPGDKARLESEARARGLKVSQYLLAALRLMDCLTTSQWRWWEREAESRGLTPEQLLAQACLEWQMEHVRDVPLL